MGKHIDALKIPFYPAHPSNYTSGRGRPIRAFTVHHIAGTPSTLRYLWGDATRNGSSTFGVFPNKIEQYVGLGNTPWTNGNWASNQESITCEVYGDWRNGRTYPVLDELKQLMKACLRDYPHLVLTFHQDVSDKYTACPAQLRAHAQRIWNEAKAELAAPKPKPKPKINYKPIAKKTVLLRHAANLWNFNATSWGQINKQAVKAYPKGHAVEVVAVATNQLGSKYYMTGYSYNNGNIRATNGFNIVDVEDYVPPKPKPEPKPEPEKPKLIGGLKFTKYERPIKVETVSNKVKLWDFNYKTWGDIVEHAIEQYDKGHEIVVVGDVEHPLGGTYVMSEYSFGDADKTGIPHKTWGFNVVDVKEIEALPKPEPKPEPEPEPETPPEASPEQPQDGEPTDAGSGDVLEPESGEGAATWLERVLKWVREILNKFKFGG